MSEHETKIQIYFVNVSGFLFRNQYYQGPSHHVNLDMGKRYAVEGWVKLLNNGQDILQYIEIEIAETLTNGKFYILIKSSKVLNQNTSPELENRAH